MDSPHKDQWRGAFDILFHLRLNKCLNKQSKRWWFGTPSRSSQYDVTVMLNGNCCILIRLSVTFVAKGPVNNMSSLAQVMGPYLTRNETLSEPSLAELLTHICFSTFERVHALVHRIWWGCDTQCAGLIVGLRPANERRRYFVTTSLIGWSQT